MNLFLPQKMMTFNFHPLRQQTHGCVNRTELRARNQAPERTPDDL